MASITLGYYSSVPTTSAAYQTQHTISTTATLSHKSSTSSHPTPIICTHTSLYKTIQASPALLGMSALQGLEFWMNLFSYLSEMTSSWRGRLAYNYIWLSSIIPKSFGHNFIIKTVDMLHIVVHLLHNICSSGWIFTWGQFWPSGIIDYGCPSMCVCVSVTIVSAL